MSKKFKSQASSARAASAAFGSQSPGFGTLAGGFQTTSSPLSYITELPDLSGITEPHIIVSFKNLGKKDSTTKAKALEELQEYVSSVASDAGLQPAAVEAWTSLYPRTSIDNSRRVRLLAHNLQGLITSVLGKQVVPYLPKVAGPWLSGAFDNDKGVSRSAQDALETSFPAVEKRRALWKIYKTPLLEYAEDAILVQTALTLSDERSTSPDDAQAKHVRVVGSAIHMLSNLIKANDYPPDSSNYGADLRKTLENKRLWEFSYHPDPYLRRGVDGLVTLCVEHLDSVLDWQIVSECFVSRGLHSTQAGSSRQFSQALIVLTKHRPQIWTTDYSAKTPVSRRLLQYLRQGSQRGPEDVWSNIAALIKIIPLSAWTSDSGDADILQRDSNNLLDTMLMGIRASDEPRPNANAAWSAYVDLSFWIIDQFLQESSKEATTNRFLLPVVTQFMVKDSEQVQWSISSSAAVSICATILVQTLQKVNKLSFETAWSGLVDVLIEKMKMSLPESSKDFKGSQDAVIAQSRRLFTLKQEVINNSSLKESDEADMLPMLKRHTKRLLSAAQEILTVRNGKPYGCAGVMENALAQGDFDQENDGLKSFFGNNVPDLLDSVSAEPLISVLLLSQYSITTVLQALIAKSNPGPNSMNALIRLLKGVNVQDLNQNQNLEPYIIEKIQTGLQRPFGQEIALSVLGNRSLLKSGLHAQVMAHLMQNLSLETPPELEETAMGIFDTLLSNQVSTDSLTSEPIATTFMSKLVIATDSAIPEVADHATSLISRLRSITTSQGSSENSTMAIIQDQLNGVGRLLSIYTLVDLAKAALQDYGLDRGEILESTFPTTDQWQKALHPHLATQIPTSLSITSALQGIVLVSESDPSVEEQLIDIPRDADDFSVAFRLALYVIKLLPSTTGLSRQSPNRMQDTYKHLPLALQLINEKLTLDSANKFWLHSTAEVLEEAADVVLEGNAFLSAWVRETSTEDSVSFGDYWLATAPTILGVYSESFLRASAFASIAENYVDSHGAVRLIGLYENDLKMISRSADLAKSAALLVVLRDYLSSHKHGRRICNELVADATETKDLQRDTNALRPVILLNILLRYDRSLLEGLPPQRIVFLLKNMVTLLQHKPRADVEISEVYKVIECILPAVADVYGQHWEDILNLLSTQWNQGFDLKHDLLLLHSSLHLYDRLRRLVTHDGANEDLLEAWELAQPGLNSGLLKCLHAFKDAPVGVDQPRQITAGLLRRQLANLTVQVDNSMLDLLNSSEEAVQIAAYELLHRAIPAQQEQRSIDLALEQTASHLPTELVSFMIDAPALPDELSDDDILRTTTRRYLISWNLVFDHFSMASYKLQESYAADIRNSHHLETLLDYIYQALHIVSTRPVDTSKYDVKQFEIGEGESMEIDLLGLTVHIYYKCLLYLPSSTKEWFIEQKNRIKSPLETWTQKHLSPLIVSASLTTVSKWAAGQPQQVEDRPISIKASAKGSELVAAMNVDPDSPPISLAVSFPGAYPLESPVVTSRSRVGVSEKNWQSWMRTIQIIIFSTGSIIEGLIAFRRNVQGALKGQNECAICYSIIGTDMQTPSKRCGTCRNTFHGSCLFRWFKSSNSSSCPLCRNNFNYA